MKDENIHFTYDFVEEKNDSKYKLPMWVLGTLGGLVAVIVILITIIIINASKSNKTDEKIIQFNEACFEVVFEGYNTMGEAYVKPVYSELEKAILAVVEDMDNSDEILKRVMDNNPPEYDPEYEESETVEQKITPILKYYCNKYFSNKEIEYFSNTTVYEIYKSSPAKAEWEQKVKTYRFTKEKFLNMKICK